MPARHDVLEKPCSQCGGDGWEEEPSHFAQGRCDGDIIYRRVDCDRCGGSGEEPPTKCECGAEATETFEGEEWCAECAEFLREEAA